MTSSRPPLSVRHARAALVWVALVTSLVGIVGVMAASVVFEDQVEQLTAGKPPALFYDAASSTPNVEPTPTATVFAHNTGDDTDALKLALDHGAQAVEIDVVLVDGVLYAAHDRPPSVLGDIFLRRPHLDSIWASIPVDTTVMLDLKQTSAGFVRTVGAFLEENERQNLVIASRSSEVLRALRPFATDAQLALSIGDQNRLDATLADTDAIAAIDGVTIRHSLLDTDTMAELIGHELNVIAWTVNDVDRASELLALGASAVTTDNLAIIERTAA